MLSGVTELTNPGDILFALCCAAQVRIRCTKSTSKVSLLKARA
jgi:hypothetical protein